MNTRHALVGVLLAAVSLAACAGTEAAGPRTDMTVDVAGRSPAQPPPADDPTRQAAVFAERWARSDLPPDDWWSTLTDLCTHQFATLLRPQGATLPSPRRLLGAPTLTSAGPAAMNYTARTEAGTLLLSLVPQDGAWKINRAELAAVDIGRTMPQEATSRGPR
jgi:hypothetical protein